MEPQQPKKTVREEFAEKFIAMLESDKPLSWTQGWATSGLKLPYNGESGRKYNGINRFALRLIRFCHIFNGNPLFLLPLLGTF